MIVRTAKNREFNVVVVETGMNYGLNNVLVNEDAPLVEFWDNEYETSIFVTRYNLETIKSMPIGYGLNLDGGVDEWSIDATTMELVINWLKLNFK